MKRIFGIRRVEIVAGQVDDLATALGIEDVVGVEALERGLLEVVDGGVARRPAIPIVQFEGTGCGGVVGHGPADGTVDPDGGEVHHEGGWFEAQGEFPQPGLLAFPLSKEADRFYEYGPPFLQRFLPFWAASLVDRLKVMLLPLLVLLFPLIKVMPPIYTSTTGYQLHPIDVATNKALALAGIDATDATITIGLLDGHSQAEIADGLGITAGVVSRRIHRNGLLSLAESASIRG